MDSHQWYCLLYLTPSDGEQKRVWKDSSKKKREFGKFVNGIIMVRSVQMSKGWHNLTMTNS